MPDLRSAIRNALRDDPKFQEWLRVESEKAEANLRKCRAEIAETYARDAARLRARLDWWRANVG